jgi:hypothetical protein
MLDWEYHLERQKDLLREVERERLVRELRQVTGQRRGALAASLALAAGRVMVRVGVWLESLGKPVADYADEVG